LIAIVFFLLKECFRSINLPPAAIIIFAPYFRPK